MTQPFQIILVLLQLVHFNNKRTDWLTVLIDFMLWARPVWRLSAVASASNVLKLHENSTVCLIVYKLTVSLLTTTCLTHTHTHTTLAGLYLKSPYHSTASLPRGLPRGPVLLVVDKDSLQQYSGYFTITETLHFSLISKTGSWQTFQMKCALTISEE